MTYVLAMQKCAPRCGESTISESGIARVSQTCSQDHMFYQVKRRWPFLCQKAAMKKCARRWGESTISESCLARASEPCSENPIFYKENQRFLVPREVRGSRAATTTPSPPGEPRGHLIENKLPRAPKSCSENPIFYKGNRKFHVLLPHDICSCYAKMCTAPQREHHFEIRGKNVQNRMLPKPYFLPEI